jgi:putative ABC transport system permease protein
MKPASDKVSLIARSTTLESVVQDLRFGLRTLLRSPGFTLVAVVTLALGIGANTAIFSVMNTVLLRDLPYDEPDQVVQLLAVRQGQFVRRGVWLAYPEIEDMRQTTTLSHVSAWQSWWPVMYGPDDPSVVGGASVSASYFGIFGISPALGRFFLPEEEELGHEPVTVLSYGFWQQLGGDPAMIGESLDLDGTRYTVVGVAPAEFEDPSGNRRMWRARPPHWDRERMARNNHSWRAIARVADGVTIGQAQADMDRLWLAFAEEYPQFHTNEAVTLMTAKEWMVGNVRLAILVLLGSVGLVLLIACANVANLLLTRTVNRSREVALRASLGAGSGRITRQIVTEVCLLFALGGGAGLLLAYATADHLGALARGALPRITEVQIDGVVLAATLAITLVTGVVFGLTAAYPTIRSDLAAALQLGGRSTRGDRRSERLRGSLVVAEVALSLLLLAGSGLLLKSLWRLQQVEPGFRSENVLAMSVAPRAGDYAEHAEITLLYDDFIERIRAMPGVIAAGAINSLPMTGAQNCERVWPDARPLPTSADQVTGPRCLEVRVVTPEYFSTMGMPMLRGRDFGELDDAAGNPVVVINQAAAAAGFPDEEPLGQRITLFETRAWLPDVSREIVGVVGNVRQVALAADPIPAMYVALDQEPDPGRRRGMTVVVRAEGDLTPLANAARETLRQIDRNILLASVNTMDDIVARTVSGSRFRVTLILLFGAVALLLAAVGVAGVVGYTISQRIPEIGIRMALGAQTASIYALVMRQGAQLIGWGIALGLAGAFAITRVMSGLLFEVSALDPAAFLAAGVLMTAIALLAVWVPARRATRVDPMEVLRTE